MENQKTLCLLGWCAVGAAALVLFAERFLGIHIRILWPPCLFHVLTGYYCPGCGGTRAALALLHGNFFLSLKYHPVVPYAAALFLWALITNTAELATKGRRRIGLRFRKRHLVILLVLTAIHFVGVNWCKWKLGIDLLG